MFSVHMYFETKAHVQGYYKTDGRTVPDVQTFVCWKLLQVNLENINFLR